MSSTKYDKKTAGKIYSLQIVRAIAFLGILSSHCKIIELGAWGASVFFILSGFLMFYSYQNRNLNCSLKDSFKFSVGKIKKLYLLHILIMIAALVFIFRSLMLDFSLKHLVLYLGEIFFNVLLLQAWVPSSSVYFSLNGVSWYLSACLFLYACFPRILKYIKRLNINKSLIVAICIYASQIVIGMVTQFVNIPIVYFDSFSKWFTYIFPLFRLGDFIIGCCFGNIFLNKKFSLNKLSATIFEIVIFIILICSQFIYSNQIGFLGSEWFRYTMLYTPTSVCIILLFALNKGIISNVLNHKSVIYIGNISAYAFLIHQVVIRYIDTFSSKIIGHSLNHYILLILSFIITIICAEIYKRIEYKIKNANKVTVK